MMCYDYEDLILQRQEEIEFLEDGCDGECERCPFVEYVYRSPFDDGYPVCTIFNEED